MKRDCFLFSVNVKVLSAFFVMREKANYLCVKVFSEEVQGTLFRGTATEFTFSLLFSISSVHA